MDEDAPTTAKLNAYVTASPKLSKVPESSDDEPLSSDAATIITKVPTLIASTVINTRRCLAASARVSSLSQLQQSPMTPPPSLHFG